MDELITKWVKPFYLKGLEGSDVAELKAALAEVDPDIVDRLLGTRNWRERIVGSWFCGLKGWTQNENQIGWLLLASEVCYAGQGHCFAMACFQNDASRRYLVDYLDIYLRQPDKFYDQGIVMSALLWIDQKLGTNDAARFLEPGGLWDTFTADKNHAWSFERWQSGFWGTMDYCQRNFGAPP